MRNVDSDAPLLLFINSTTRYLLEFFFGNRVAGEVIYYLFEIFKNDTALYVPLLRYSSTGEFACGVIFYHLEIFSTGGVPGGVIYYLFEVFQNELHRLYRLHIA